MAHWDYKVVALPRDLTVIRRAFQNPSEPAVMVADFVQREIEKMSNDGWEFYRCDSVNMVEKPGCLGALLGQKETYLSFNVLTFRKDKPA